MPPKTGLRTPEHAPDQQERDINCRGAAHVPIQPITTPQATGTDVLRLGPAGRWAGHRRSRRDSNEVDTAAFAAAIRPLVTQKLTTDVTRRIHEQTRAAAATAG